MHKYIVFTYLGPPPTPPLPPRVLPYYSSSPSSSPSSPGLFTFTPLTSLLCSRPFTSISDSISNGDFFSLFLAILFCYCVSRPLVCKLFRSRIPLSKMFWNMHLCDVYNK